MNELQIRLKADIQQFQAAMSTVETKLKSAEGILKKASTTADKYRGSLANLSAQFKKGAISQSDYDKQATKLSNGLLKQQDIINNSTREINRLNNEYKRLNTAPLIASQSRLAASTNNLGGSVAGLTGNIRGVNSVAIEFSRIVQDAPFGIIGVGNNIQQLASNFSNLARNAGGTIPAIKAAFSALATGPNLALLAISALTSAFTLYQMSSRKTKEEVDELAAAQDNLNDSLKETDKLARAQFYAQILKDIGVLKEEFTAFGKVLVDSGLESDEILQKIAERIRTATKPELEALESFLRTKYQDSVRASTNATTELEKQLGSTDAQKYSEQLALVTKELEFYSNESGRAKKAGEDLLDVFTDTQWQEAVDNQEALFRALNSLSIESLEGGSPIQGIIDELDRLGPPVKEFADEFQQTANQTKTIAEEIAGAFTGLAFQVSNSLNIQNQGLKSFIGTLITNTPKIIQAINAQARAAQTGALLTNKANAKVATGNAIVTATSAAKGLGPIGLALLPVFISGALALISGAFGRIGGGGSAGGSVSSSTGTTFTNARPQGATSIPFPVSNNVGTTGISNEGARMEIDVNITGFARGEDILFVTERAAENRRNR